MKLRIKGNSIRLRLTQPEVERLGRGQRNEESVDFGPGSGRLSYAIETSPNAASVTAGFEDDRIVVVVPQQQATVWARSETVAIAGDDSGSLAILIEKDFACLRSRPGEDEADMFPNPGETVC